MIPFKNRSVSGGGLRAWGLGEGLKSKGHDVIYSVPKKIIENKNISEDLLKYSYDPSNLKKIIRKVVPDIILFEQWGLATYLEESNIPVVIDLHGSLILENYFREHGNFSSNVAAKIKTFAKADYIICPSQRQKNYFLPWMMLSGFQIGRDQIGVIPVSFSPNLPKKKSTEKLTFVFGGGLWPWIDPFPALKIIADEIKDKKKGSLKIYSQEPDIEKILPKDDILKRTVVNLNHLYMNKRVNMVGFISHDTLIEEYTQSSVAVDIYQRNKERELAFSTRTIEYLWCGLPVIHADYSELSSYIKEYRAGWCINPRDTKAIQDTFTEIFSHPNMVKEFGKNAQQLVKEKFTWDRTIDPLHEFVSHPSAKITKKTFFDLISLEFDRIEEEIESENKKIKVELVEKENEIKQVKQSVENEKRKREEELLLLNKEIQKLNEQLIEEIRTRHREKENAGRHHAAEIQRTNKEVGEGIRIRDEEIYRLNVEIKKALNEQNEAAKSVMGYKEEIERIKEQLSSKGIIVTELNAETQGLKERESQLNQIINEQRGLISGHLTTITEREEELYHLKEELAEYDDSLTRKEEELSQMKEVVAEYDKSLAQREEELSQLKEEITEYNDSLNHREKELSQSKKVIAEYNNSLALREEELSRLKEVIAKYDDSLTRKEEELSQMKEVVAEYDKSLAQREEELSQLKEEITEYNDSLNQRNNQLLQLKNEIEKVRESFAKRNKELSGLNNELEKHRQGIFYRDEEIDRIRNNLNVATELVKHLEGVLRSIQNRFPYRLYKLVQYKCKRLFRQYPQFFYLFILNIITNFYLSRLHKKKGVRIFPAQ